MSITARQRSNAAVGHPGAAAAESLDQTFRAAPVAGCPRKFRSKIPRSGRRQKIRGECGHAPDRSVRALHPPAEA